MEQRKMSNVFGFSTEPATAGDWLPIIKYDARAGRIFRVEKVQGADGFYNEQIDITTTFKAVFDFDNIEVGWLDFPMGSAPSFHLVPMGQQLPAKPSEKHKNGVRVMLKLAPSCGGDKQVREIASSAKAFLGGIEQIYSEYARDKAKYPGQLPVITLVSTTPVTTGSGITKSTNYRPTFRIDGWKPRPADLIHKAAAKPAATNGSGTAPSTGGQTVPPPNNFRDAGEFGELSRNTVPQVHANLDDDFG
jgi:type II secretory pathway pseudopilin PulG